MKELRIAIGEDSTGAPPGWCVVPAGEDDWNRSGGVGDCLRGGEALARGTLLLHRQARQPAAKPQQIPEFARRRLERGASWRIPLPVERRPIELGIEAAPGAQQQRISHPEVRRRLANCSQGRCRIRKLPRPAHDEDRPPPHPQVSRIRECRGENGGVRELIGPRLLSGEAGVCPALVGPAEAEREIWLARGQHFGERALELPPACAPVVEIAESVDAVCASQVGLRQTHLGHTQVAVAEIRRNSRLVVAREESSGARQLLPGARVTGRRREPTRQGGSGVEMRQVEGNDPGAFGVECAHAC